MGTVGKVENQLLEGGLLFRLSDEGIARHFTQAFFSGNVWQTDIGLLRDFMSTVDGCPKSIPADPAEFSTWVRKKLLRFESLPRNKLAELYENASEDLATIASNIAYCEQELRNMNRQAAPTDDDAPTYGFFQYFLELNTDARNEIIEVLASQSRMQNEALRASRTPLFRDYIDFHVPWSFRWFPERYSSRDYSRVDHAFGNLPIAELDHVRELYRGRQWALFDREVVNYLQEYKPAEAVRAWLTQHHLLAARQDVLRPALDAYDRGEFPLFISAVAVQIEGVFEDACHLSEIVPGGSRGAVLFAKLQALWKKKDVIFDYPYFAFYFPRVRNRVAHGRKPGDNIERIAHLLLLDLHNACEIVATHPAASNEMVSFLKQKEPGRESELDLVKFAVLYTETDGQAPDDFYGLATEFNNALLALDSQVLWRRLGEMVGTDRDEVVSGLRSIATKLKKLRPSLKRECGRLLAQLGNHGGEEFERSTFLAAVATIPNRVEDMGVPADARRAFLSVLFARQHWMQTIPSAAPRTRGLA